MEDEGLNAPPLRHRRPLPFLKEGTKTPNKCLRLRGRGAAVLSPWRQKMSCFARVAAAMNEFVREKSAGDNCRLLMFTKATINCSTDERF